MNEYLLLAASAVRSLAVNLAGRRRAGYARPRRILVVKLDHLGDVILATPALRALRESHPGVPVDAVVLPGMRAILEGSDLVDRVIAYDAARYRRGSPREPAEGPRADHAALLRALVMERYDWVVEFRGDEWTAGAMLDAVRPARRFDRGTVRCRDWVGRRLARWIGRRPRPDLHEVETNLAVVRGALAEEPSDPRVEVPRGTGARDGLLRALRTLGTALDPAVPYAVLHLGASWAPRAWSAGRFGAVAAALRGAYDAQIVVVGTAEDAPLREEFLTGGGPTDATFCFGTLSIPEVAELLRGARLYVGSDGGGAHLAAACATPSIVLFGPQNPARFRPWAKRIVVLHHPVPCYPCAQVVCVRPADPCVNLTSVGEVLRAAETLWESARLPPIGS